MNASLTALITNDDGIDSLGLHELAKAAIESGLNVFIAAPAIEASGSSAAITATERDGRILLTQHTIEGLEGIPAYAVNAAPALITLIAGHGAFGTVPDLVLSGINRGANIGRAILHSGTVGAALTGGVNGGRAMAISLDIPVASGPPRWANAATLAGRLIPFLIDQPAGTVLNLNVPAGDGGHLPEYRAAALAAFGIVQTTMTEREGQHIRLAVADLSAPQDPGSDAYLLTAGYATVTAIRTVEEDTSTELADRLPSRLSQP